MTFEVNGGVCRVARDPGEKFRSDSQVFFRLREVMRAKGFDVVKRNMEQDGHMMGDRHTYYLRHRYWAWAIYDGDYAIRSTAKDLNESGLVLLTFEDWSKKKSNIGRENER